MCSKNIHYPNIKMNICFYFRRNRTSWNLVVNCLMRKLFKVIEIKSVMCALYEAKG